MGTITIDSAAPAVKMDTVPEQPADPKPKTNKTTKPKTQKPRTSKSKSTTETPNEITPEPAAQPVVNPVVEQPAVSTTVEQPAPQPETADTVAISQAHDHPDDQEDDHQPPELPADFDAAIKVVNDTFAEIEKGEGASIKQWKTIGIELEPLKKRVGHGNWLPFVKRHLPFERSKANAAIKIAKKWVMIAAYMHDNGLTGITINQALKVTKRNPKGEGEGGKEKKAPPVPQWDDADMVDALPRWLAQCGVSVDIEYDHLTDILQAFGQSPTGVRRLMVKEGVIPKKERTKK